jgi:hypothetical protein
MPIQLPKVTHTQEKRIFMPLNDRPFLEYDDLDEPGMYLLDRRSNPCDSIPFTGVRGICLHESARPHGLPHHVTQRGNRREAIFFEASEPTGRRQH